LNFNGHYRQERQYCKYAEGDFGFFTSRGRHVAPTAVKFGTAEETEGRFSIIAIYTGSAAYSSQVVLIN